MGSVGGTEHDGGIRVLRGAFNVLGYVVNGIIHISDSRLYCIMRNVCTTSSRDKRIKKNCTIGVPRDNIHPEPDIFPSVNYSYINHDP